MRGEAPSLPLALDRGSLAAGSDLSRMLGPAVSLVPFPGAPKPPVPAATIPASVAAGVVEAADCAPTSATWLARMAVGEADDVLATARITDDHAGLHQTARNVARRTGTTFGEALRALAPRLHGDRPQSRRQAWVSGLPACGDEPPPTWRDCREHPHDCDGDWRLYRAGWATIRTWAAQAVSAQAPGAWSAPAWAPCPGEPIAYGCSDCETPGGCCDDAFALERGLCRLDCGERLAFWAKPGNGCDHE